MAILGSTLKGDGNSDSYPSGTGRLNRLQATEDGTITDISGWLGTTSGTPTSEQFRWVIYRGTASDPNDLVYESATINHSGAGDIVMDHTLSSSISMTNGEYLWCGTISVSGDSRLLYTSQTGGRIMDASGAGIPAPEDISGTTFDDYRYNSWLTYTTGGGSPTIDSYPSTVRSGDTGVAFTTTGLSTITSITLGSLAATSISHTLGDGTHDVPALTDENVHGLYGTRTVTITGAEGAPTTTTDFQPAANQSFVTLSGTLNTSINGVLYNFSPAAVVGDQMVWDTDKGTCDAQGNYETSFEGEQYLWHIQASTGIARLVLLETGVPSVKNIWRQFPSNKIKPRHFVAFPDSKVKNIVSAFWELEPVFGSFAGTTTSVSSSISGTVSSSSVSGSFSGTLQNASSSISGNLINTGAFSGTLTNASSSISGNVVNSGAFAGSTASVSSSISATVKNTGSFSGSLASISSNISANVINSGSFSASTASVSSSISGSIGSSPTSGAFSGTLTSVSSSISGSVTNTGSFSATTQSVSSFIAATVKNTGSFGSTTESIGSSIGTVQYSYGIFAGSTQSISSSIIVNVINTGAFSSTTQSVSSLIDCNVFDTTVPTEFFPYVIVSVDPDYQVSLEREFGVKIESDFMVEVTHGV